MVRKSSPHPPKKKPAPKASPRKKPESLYPSLAQGPTPAERCAKLVAEARKRGVKPWTEEDFDRLMEGSSDWPDEEFEEFLAWLRRSRREGRY